MAGVAEDIQRAEARGFVHTGFGGRATEYQVYTCQRTGLQLSIPLGIGPYLVHSAPPDAIEVGKTHLINEAFALIAQAPSTARTQMTPRSTPQDQAGYVTRHAREAALRVECRGNPGSPKPPAQSAQTATPAGATPVRARREHAGMKRESRIGTSDTSAGFAGSESDAEPAWRRLIRIILLGVPCLLLLVWMTVSEMLPLLLLPTMFVLGLEVWGVMLVGALAGASWGLAASTWLSPRNLLTVTGGAALGALAAWLIATPDELLGSHVPLYGAVATASIASVVIEKPRLMRSWMIATAITGATLGTLLSGQLVADQPQAALWLTAITVHGMIALGSPRIWDVLFGHKGNDAQRRQTS